MSCQCHHLEPQRLDLPVPDPATYNFLLVDNLPEKGRSWPPIRQIEINTEYWKSLTRTQRGALLSHELAHLEKGPARRDDGGVPCENCADTRAGAIMAGMGFNKRETMRAAQQIIKTRPRAAYAYGSGWSAWQNSRIR